MNRLIAICSLLPLLAGAGCSQEDEILPRQKEQTVSFLRSSHTPRLVPEEEADPESQSPYYTTAGNTVYRYITDVYNPDRAEWPEVTRTSTVTITFRAYVFTYSTIVTEGQQLTMPYYTNDPDLEYALYEAGLTPGAWPFEPYVVDMRSPGIIKGLRLALLGCREGDYVEAYMTYNMAYGDPYMYTVPRESPVAYFFTVDKVE